MIQIICTKKEQDLLIEAMDEGCPLDFYDCPLVRTGPTYHHKDGVLVPMSCEECLKKHIDWTIIDEV